MLKDTSSDLTLEEIELIAEKKPLMGRALKKSREQLGPFPTALYLSLCYALAKDPEKNGICLLSHVDTGEQVPAEDMEIEVEEGRDYYLIYSSAKQAALHSLDQELEEKYPRREKWDNLIPIQATPLQAITDREEMLSMIEKYKKARFSPHLVSDLESLYDCDIYLNGVPIVDFIFGGVRRDQKKEECDCMACRIRRAAEHVLGPLPDSPPMNPNSGLLPPGEDDDRPDFIDLLGGGPGGGPVQ